MNKNKISLSTAVFIVMGSMIGSGIFIVSADMSRILGNPLLLLLVWVISGALSMIGAQCYSELSSMFPRSGGQYQYLKESFNPLLAFLNGWAIFLVIQSGAIAAVAVAFSKFTGLLFPVISTSHVLFTIVGLKISSAQILAIISLFVLTYINTLGIRYGGVVQRVLTIIKLGTLAFLIVFGIFIFRNAEAIAMNFNDFFHASYKSLSEGALTGRDWTFFGLLSAIGVAMVGALFSSDAWNNVTYISEEIENPAKNVSKSLLIGVFGVTILYVLTNVSYLCMLPMWGHADGVSLLQRGIQGASEDRVATASMTLMFGNSGTMIMALFIIISTFGCNNGLILSGARVYQSMAADGLFFSKMKDLNKHHVPAFSLWVQFAWCSILCLSGKYSDLLDYVMFVVVIFYILTISGLIVLRIKKPELERPNKAFGYPFLPILYIIAMSAFAINLVIMKPENTIPGILLVLAGIPLYYFWKRKKAL